MPTHMALHLEAKVTVLSLLIFPAQEAWKDEDDVAGAIDICNKDLESLTQFAAQNASLVNLVKGLLDELSHDIMEDLAEIKEDYFEKSRLETTAESSAFSNKKKDSIGGPKATVDDEEYARMMSLLDKLEKEEEEQNDEGSHEVKMMNLATLRQSR